MSYDPHLSDGLPPFHGTSGNHDPFYATNRATGYVGRPRRPHISVTDYTNNARQSGIILTAAAVVFGLVITFVAMIVLSAN